MHSFNKNLLLSLLMVLGIMQPLHAGLAGATDSASAAQPASLAQATAQSHAPAATLAQAAEQAKPSTVALAVGQIEGKRVLMTTQFTPEEIDKYPGYEQAFAVHAATHLESENPADIAAIEHFIDKYPNFAAFFDGMASKGGPINNNIRKRLNRANRQPIMSLENAATVAGNSAMYGFVIAGSQALAVEEARKATFNAAKIALADNLIQGQPCDRMLHALRAKESSFADDVSKQQKGHLKQFVEEVPRTMTIAVGTAALTSVTLREFDERIGDPFPTPKYDPKSYNVSRYSHIAAKWALRNIVVPFVLGKYVVTPVVDRTVDVLSGAHDE